MIPAVLFRLPRVRDKELRGHGRRINTTVRGLYAEGKGEKVMDITGIDKAEILAALYNNAKPLGMGFIHFTPEDMSTLEAREILAGGQTYFDYHRGRVMKVDLSKDELDTFLYNRDNGKGAVEEVIESIRK